jgi:hypothetical protein
MVVETEDRVVPALGETVIAVEEEKAVIVPT